MRRVPYQRACVLSDVDRPESRVTIDSRPVTARRDVCMFLPGSCCIRIPVSSQRFR